MSQARRSISYKGCEVRATATLVGEGGHFCPGVEVARGAADAPLEVPIPPDGALLDSEDEALEAALQAGRRWLDEHPA